MSEVVYAYVRKLKNPLGGCARTHTRSINAGVCPTRVHLASLGTNNPVIAVVLQQCSTVQETALLVVGARRSRAGAKHSRRVSLAICCRLRLK